jgi:hypothetical protein
MWLCSSITLHVTAARLDQTCQSHLHAAVLVLNTQTDPTRLRELQQGLLQPAEYITWVMQVTNNSCSGVARWVLGRTRISTPLRFSVMVHDPNDVGSLASVRVHLLQQPSRRKH